MKISNFKLNKIQPNAGEFMPPSFWATVDLTETRFWFFNRTKTVGVFKAAHGNWRWQDTGKHTSYEVDELAMAFAAKQYKTNLESCDIDE